MGTLLRWDPPIHPEGLEEGEEAKADGRVVPAGWLVFRNRPQPAEVSGVQGGPQQEGRGAGTFSRLLSLLLFQTVKLYDLTFFFLSIVSFWYFLLHSVGFLEILLDPKTLHSCNCNKPPFPLQTHLWTFWSLVVHQEIKHCFMIHSFTFTTVFCKESKFLCKRLHIKTK